VSFYGVAPDVTAVAVIDDTPAADSKYPAFYNVLFGRQMGHDGIIEVQQAATPYLLMLIL
jgi:hypothetical protein